MKIIFDLDGTLFASGKLAIKSYKRVFDIMGLKKPSDKKLLSTLGYPIHEIWEILMPKDKEKRIKASKLMEKVENELIEEGVGELFPKVMATLNTLAKNGHQLMILSNCDKPYLDVIAKRFNFEEVFAELHCAGMYQKLTKSEILSKLLNGDTDAMMVGDRFHDIQAGIDNKITTIWCNYGYSDQKLKADYEVNQFSDILEIVTGI